MFIGILQNCGSRRKSQVCVRDQQERTKDCGYCWDSFLGPRDWGERGGKMSGYYTE